MPQGAAMSERVRRTRTGKSSGAANSSGQSRASLRPHLRKSARLGGASSLQRLSDGGRMRRCGNQRGFSLIEVVIAMMLVGVAMTGLLVAFVASGQFGVLSRRQATALAVARSVSGQLSRIAYNDARLSNTNANNDATIADPNGLFARSVLPTGNDAPDSTLPVQTVGIENYEVYVNVALQMGDGTWDPITLEIG